jgi:hypothetical protein
MRETGVSVRMANPLESEGSSTADTAVPASPGLVKLGVVAAASVLAGGLAAAWWYRKTLSKLRQADEKQVNPDFGIPEDEARDDV